VKKVSQCLTLIFLFLFDFRKLMTCETISKNIPFDKSKQLQFWWLVDSYESYSLAWHVLTLLFWLNYQFIF